MAQTAPGQSQLDRRRSRIDAEGQAKVIYLLFHDKLSIEVVAQRFGVGASTIRRVREAYYEKIERKNHGGQY